VKTRLALAYTIFIVACCAARAGAAVPPSFSFQVTRAPHPLALDPSMSDPVWQAGKVPSPASWENVTTRAPAAENTGVYFEYDGFVRAHAQHEFLGFAVAATRLIRL